MRQLVLPISRRLLPFARWVWSVLPDPVRLTLRPPMRRLRTRLGLGNWGSGAAVYRQRLADVHPLVPVVLDLPEAFAVPPIPRSTAGDPLVTIVVTVHDDEPFLDTCLWSVRAQDGPPWECIVVDDASVDDSTEIARRHAEADPRIRLVRRDRNVGLAAARNTGIALARGTFIAFLDADDFMFPSTLRARVEAATSEDSDVAGSWCDWSSIAEAAGLEFVPSGVGRFSAIDYTTGCGENQVISTSPLLRTDVVRSLGGYDIDFRTAEDFEFITRILRNGFRLEYAAVVGIVYRQKRSSMISGDPLGHARNAMRVYDYMRRPLSADARSVLARHPIIDPPPGIPSEVKRIERLISFLTFAVLGGDAAQISGVLDLLPPGLMGSSSFLLDVDGRIDAALRRHTTRVAEFEPADRAQIANHVKELLVQRAGAEGSAAPVAPHPGVTETDRLASLLPEHSRVRPQRLPPAAGPWDVVLVADSRDAVRELTIVGRELVEDGFCVAMLDRGGADVRRALHAEGIHRVVSPTGDARLIISSHGDTTGIRGQHHMVIAAEPWIGAIPDTMDADVVHARGPWELPLLSSLGPCDQVGWHTRHDRIQTMANPEDGQIHRGRSDVVVVVAAEGVAVPSAADVARRLPDRELLFGRAFGAGPGVTLEDSGVRRCAGLADAVVCVGPQVLAEALAFGTPVVQIDDTVGRDISGVTRSEWDELPDALGGLVPSDAWTAWSNQDPLQRHLDAAREFLS